MAVACRAEHHKRKTCTERSPEILSTSLLSADQHEFVRKVAEGREKSTQNY